MLTHRVNVVSLALAAAFGLTPAISWAKTATVVKKFDLKAEQAAGRLGDEVKIESSATAGGPDELVATGDSDFPGTTIRLLKVESPGVGCPGYMLRGQVRYDDVEGIGFLEMWNFFPEDMQYFTRTLGDEGLMKHLEGTSDWREFILPFDLSTSNDPKLAASRLEFNIMLPGKGTARLRDLELVQFTAGGGGWWDDRMGGIIGGIGGTLIGGIGAIVGIVCSLGRGRGFAIALLTTTIVFSSLSLIAGVSALVLQQPYAVWFPLVLLGVLGTAIPASLLPVVRLGFRQRELRRMSALDAV